MISQRGGLKRINTEKLPNDVLLDMINSDGATLQFLAHPTSSVGGIIAILNVKPEYSAYTGLDTTGEFTLVVTSFVIKFVITTPNAGNGLAAYYKENGKEPLRIVKSSESNKSFYDEAALQQYIWLETILGRKPPIEICPSIGSLSLLNNLDAKSFLRNIGRSKRSNLTDLLENFLSLSFNPGLGIILMRHVENAVPLSSLIDIQDVSILIAQIVRLFLFLKVIHFDLHSQNALFFRVNGYGSISTMCQIIDFGEASLLSDPIQDPYLTIEEKIQILSKIDEFLIKYKYSIEHSDTDKKNFIAHIMNYLTMWDHNKNPKKDKTLILGIDEEGKLDAANQGMVEEALSQQLPGKKRQNIDALYDKIKATSLTKSLRYQMNWYEKVKQDSNVDKILLKAFNLLNEITRTGKGLCRETIESYKEDGLLFDSSIVPTSIVSKQYAVETPDANTYSCSIMGGKKKYKKSKKNKKSRKFKKTKKIRYKYKNKN